MAQPSFSQIQDDVADRVLRRAQVSKMARALQDRLSLANIKIQHGWQNRSIGSIDSELGKELKRKRVDATADLMSDTASSLSGSVFSYNQPLSSPVSGPFFSDNLIRSGSSAGSIKRRRPDTTSFIHPSQTQHRSKPRMAQSMRSSWKSSYRLPESSPIRPRQRPTSYLVNQPSFTSETSTIADSPSASEDDDQDLPLQSFQGFSDTSNIPSSPPRTPSPAPSRSAQLSGHAFSPLEQFKNGGKEGADLLLHFAASPSPAMRVNKFSSPVMAPPSTPPSKPTPLPSSSMMTTPGNPIFTFGTPNTAFNFADYCNVTPSPAQARWGFTPAAAKTPGSVIRREGLMAPPGHSPNLLRHNVKDKGLGVEFGGQLLR